MFLPQETIRAKRDGRRLDTAAIERFVAGLVDGRVSDAQAAAFAMAVLLNGMDRAERVALTQAMTRSGRVLAWDGDALGGPVVDKHSTGGVGDKVSLILAPVLAAAGAYVPMISGRGLGHTGGTLDKLDSIPGYRSRPDLATLVRVVQETGAAIVGATDDIAPADRRLYAIRDVTGTVESLDLITASILSKKLAAGLDALVMDVKTGNGAFAPTLEAAEALAGSLLDVGSGAGLAMRALITDMNQVLGWTAGNALEVAEASDVLAGRAAEPRLVRVTTALAAELLALGGLAADPADGERRVRAVLADGRAAERFERMVRALGGPADLVARPEAVLPVAPVRLPVPPARPGTVTAVDTRALGLAVIRLGGGRLDVGDRIDGAVGLAMLAGPGERVDPAGRPLAMLHAATPESAAAIAPEVAAAFTLDEDVPEGEQGNGSLTARDQGPAAADPVIRVLKPPTSA